MARKADRFSRLRGRESAHFGGMLCFDPSVEARLLTVEPAASRLTDVFGDLVMMFARAASAIQARLEKARLRRELMALDDRMLADIGLLRSDVPALIKGTLPEGRLAARLAGRNYAVPAANRNRSESHAA